MTTIFAKTVTALATLGVPYANQIYIPATGAALPDQYLVFTLITSVPEQHADDDEKLRSNRVQVTVYNRNGLQSLPDVSAAMIAAGFMLDAKYQIPYSRETGHYGLAFDYIYLEET